MDARALSWVQMDSLLVSDAMKGLASRTASANRPTTQQRVTNSKRTGLTVGAMDFGQVALRLGEGGPAAALRQTLAVVAVLADLERRTAVERLQTAAGAAVVAQEAHSHGAAAGRLGRRTLLAAQTKKGSSQTGSLSSRPRQLCHFPIGTKISGSKMAYTEGQGQVRLG